MAEITKKVLVILVIFCLGNSQVFCNSEDKIVSEEIDKQESKFFGPPVTSGDGVARDVDELPEKGVKVPDSEVESPLIPCGYASLEFLRVNLERLNEDGYHVISSKDLTCTLLTMVRQGETQETEIQALRTKLAATETELVELKGTVKTHSSQIKTVEKHLNETVEVEEKEIAALREKLYHFILRETELAKEEVTASILLYDAEIRDLKLAFNQGFTEVQNHINKLIVEYDELENKTLKMEENSENIAKNKATIAKNVAEIETLKKNLDSTVTIYDDRTSKVEAGIKAISAKGLAVISAVTQLEKDVKTLGQRATIYEIEIVGRVQEITNGLPEMEQRILTEVEAEKTRAVSVEEALQLKTFQEHRQNQDMIIQLSTLHLEVKTSLKGLAAELKTLEEFNSSDSVLVKKIRSLSDKTFPELEKKLQADLQSEITRAKKKEDALDSKIHTLQANVEKVGQDLDPRLAKVASDGKALVNKTNLEIRKELKRIEADNKKHVEEDINLKNEIKLAQLNIDLKLEGHTKDYEDFKSKTTLQIDQEVSRANGVEGELRSLILEETGVSRTAENALKTALENVIKRSTAAFAKVDKSFTEQKDRLKLLDEDLRILVDVESMRAKGTEAQLEEIVSTNWKNYLAVEADLVNQFNSNMTRVKGDIVNEYNRARSTEAKLEAKLSEEIHRAISTESNLLVSLNEEKERAVDAESKIQSLISQEIQRLDNSLEETLTVLSKTSGSMDKLSRRLKTEMGVVELATKELQSEIVKEVERATKVDEELSGAVQQESERAKEVEMSVLSTLMAEVVRADELEKNLRNNLAEEVTRAKDAEAGISVALHQASNQFDNRLDNLIKIVEAESAFVEEMGVELTRNLTDSMLELVQNVDKKVEETKLKFTLKTQAIDQDFQKCCRSSWFWKGNEAQSTKTTANKTATSTPTAGGGVLNTVLNMFGSRGSNKGKRTDLEDSETPTISRSDLAVPEESITDGSKGQKEEVAEKERQPAKESSAETTGRAIGSRNAELNQRQELIQLIDELADDLSLVVEEGEEIEDDYQDDTQVRETIKQNNKRGSTNIKFNNNKVKSRALPMVHRTNSRVINVYG